MAMASEWLVSHSSSPSLCIGLDVRPSAKCLSTRKTRQQRQQREPDRSLPRHRQNRVSSRFFSSSRWSYSSGWCSIRTEPRSLSLQRAAPPPNRQEPPVSASTYGRLRQSQSESMPFSPSSNRRPIKGNSYPEESSLRLPSVCISSISIPPTL